MSLINDAPKKDPGGGESPVSSLSGTGDAGSPAPRRGIPGLLLTLIAGLLVAVLLAVFIRPGKPRNPASFRPAAKIPLKNILSPRKLFSPGYQLNGIIIDPPAPPMAIINDKILLVGDKIGDAKVTEIIPGRVKLSVKEEEIVLTLR